MRRWIWALVALCGCGRDPAGQDLSGTSSTGNAIWAAVVRSDGRPAAGDTAFLRPGGVEGGPAAKTLVDPGGRIRFDHVAPGDWALEVRGSADGRLLRLRLGDGGSVDLGTIGLGAYGSVQGRVLPLSGAGSASVLLLGTAQRTVADSSGGFRFLAVSPGLHRVEALPRPDSSLGVASWDSVPVPDSGQALLPDRMPSKPLAPDWTLAWSDDFDSISSAVWSPDTGDGCPDKCGWGNGFLQRYRAAAAFVRDGVLVLHAENTGDGWTSGSIQSRSKMEFLYGRMEVRAWMPAVVGAWSILALQGDTAGGPAWPASGALDIASLWGDRPDSLMGIGHRTLSDGTASSPMGLAISAEGWTGRWVDFAVEWSPNEILFLADDQVFHRVDGGPPFDHPFYWALSLAVGGQGNRAPDSLQPPFELRVDRVRVWKKSN